jgi:diguanylate cyclase (GGDEF)-like protein
VNGSHPGLSPDATEASGGTPDTRRGRGRLPATTLGKTRLAATAIGVLSLVGQATQVGNPLRTETWNTGSVAAILLLVGVLVLTLARGRSLWWDPLLTPALIFVGGAGLIDPITTTGLSIAVLVVQSLYGSMRSWAIRSIGGIVAVPLAVAMSPMAAGRPVAWNSPTVIGILPQLVMMCLMMRAIHAALQRQERASAREAVLARTGSRLLGGTDQDAVRLIGDEAADELAALSPDAVLLTDGATPPDDGHWHAIDLGAGRQLFVGGPRRLPTDVVDAFRTLGHQVALGEASCRSHAELHHRAHHDHLTRLPTRALFMQQLAAAIDHSAPGSVALLNIDLDDFKQINDVYGHAAGDELLVEVATRLTGIDGADSVAARFGGDEFAVLLTNVAGPADVERIAGQLCERLIAPLQLSAATVSVGASIGAALATPQLTAGDLMRCADIAMYSAKARGKNRVEVFTPDRHGDIARHRMLEEHLAQAIDRDEIVLRYQPYLEIGTGACAGVEAIAYWRHPMLGLLPPDELLQLAERTGDLHWLGRHILRTACAEIARTPGGQTLRFGINVAARQLVDSGFADAVLGALHDSGLSADQLTLEIVEAEQIDEPVARLQLHRLAGLGVRIALDDFGTGYVSFASLRAFPIHQLKLDRSFLVDGSAADVAAHDGALDLVLSVGQILGTQMVVQGLRSAEQMAQLRGTAVDAVQGDLLAAAMPATELAAWLAAGPSAALRQALRNA